MVKKLSENKNYITRSKITRAELTKMHIPSFISVNEVKENFDKLEYKLEKAGNPYNYQQQRYTKYVNKKELYDLTIKGRTRQHK